jgi:HEAT repeat protein
MIPQTQITFEAAMRDLASDDWVVRARAASALGTCAPEDQEAACEILRKALGDERGEVRYAAALSLGELKDRGAVAQLVEQLGDGNPRAREAAALALGQIGDADGAWSALEGALREGPPEVRFQAAASLGELDVARAAPLLRVALSDEDAEVRANAACALGDAPRDDQTVEALAGLLKDGKEEPRFEAAFALAVFGDRRATAVLAAFLRDDGRALDAARGLAMLRDPESTQALAQTLRGFFVPMLVKVRAAHALARLGEKQGRQYLERMAQKRKEEVRGLASELLAELAKEEHA